MNFSERIIDRISDYNSSRKYDLFIRSFSPSESTHILDVGACEREYEKNSNLLEKKYPYPERITALGIERYDDFLRRYPKVNAVTYDGIRFPFGDNTFDICWCNAVLEHVGSFRIQERFLKEISRVAKRAFICTPNRYFPVEVHTRIPLLHYLPKKVFDAFLKKTQKQWAAGDYMNLLSLSELCRLCAGCQLTPETIIKRKILGFTLEIIVIL